MVIVVENSSWCVGCGLKLEMCDEGQVFPCLVLSCGGCSSPADRMHKMDKIFERALGSCWVHGLSEVQQHVQPGVGGHGKNLDERWYSQYTAWRMFYSSEGTDFIRS